MRVLLAAMTILAVAGCGTPAESTGGAHSEATPAPGITTFAVPPDATATFPTASTLVAPGRSPSTVDPAEACPAADTSATFSDEAEMMEGSAMAERNLGVINRYVAEHPEVSTQPYLDWSSDPPRVVLGFAGDLALHRDELGPQLADPDRVLICQVAFTSGQLAVAADEIRQRMSTDGPIVGVGAGATTVEVRLVADGEAVAAELVAAYGEMLQVTVGLLPYPMPAELAASTEVLPACDADVAGPTEMDGLVAESRPESVAVVAGDGTEGRVVFANTGASEVSFETGDPLVGVVVLPGTTEIVGTYSGDIAGVGAGGELAPGETLEVGLLVGTASCIPANGYVVPPGEYEVIAVAVVDYVQQPAQTRLVSLPAALTIVAR